MQHLKHTLESITGVEIYPLISLMIFFLFFLALGLYVWRTPRNYFDSISRVPLEDTPAESTSSTREGGNL